MTSRTASTGRRRADREDPVRSDRRASSPPRRPATAAGSSPTSGTRSGPRASATSYCPRSAPARDHKPGLGPLPGGGIGSAVGDQLATTTCTTVKFGEVTAETRGCLRPRPGQPEPRGLARRDQPQRHADHPRPRRADRHRPEAAHDRHDRQGARRPQRRRTRHHDLARRAPRDGADGRGRHRPLRLQGPRPSRPSSRASRSRARST